MRAARCRAVALPPLVARLGSAPAWQRECEGGQARGRGGGEREERRGEGRRGERERERKRTEHRVRQGA